MHTVALGAAECGDGHLAAALELAQESPLGRRGAVRCGVIEHREHAARASGVGPADNAESHLSHRGQPALATEDIGGTVGETETGNAGQREDDRVVFAGGNLCQARVHVAAQVEHTQILAQGQQLGAAPQ